MQRKPALPPDALYPRDMKGYGAMPPDPVWPGGARLAVQFVINYEEGGENSMLHGDAASESFLSEIVAATPIAGMRHMSMESLFEYGSRVGVWRLFRLFREQAIPVTVFGVAMALERNPEVAERAMEADFEICSHGYRWIDYQRVGEDEEREHMERAIAIQTRLTGQRPLGWYTGRTSPNTRRLVVEEGGFLYDSDDYSDDLPFWTTVGAETASRRSLHTRCQRHAFCHTSGIQLRRPVLHVPQGQLRCAVAGGWQNAVGWPALPPRRSSRPNRRPETLYRPRAPPRWRLVLQTHRHRPPLAEAVPATHRRG